MENNPEQPPFVPLRKAERIQQLGEIDRNIVSLLRSTAQAVQTLGKQQARDEDVTMADHKDQQIEVFQNSMNDFLRTLRSVNVGMKRQIYGLEEADIVTLDTNESQSTEAESSKTAGAGNRNVPLQPDGDGKIGGLDVGWLNSRSDKVERDMEADLWNEAEALLQRLLQTGNSSQTTDGGERYT
ncbi:mediator complex, subunit Med11 [Hypoxylon cercidicola]|nr:mediator complex, subunit Med11 [Hypoxylon cercidicola]